MRIYTLITALLILKPILLTAEETSFKLTGTPFGSEAYDYETGVSSNDAKYFQMAFDGDYNTAYASNQRSLTYVGLDLGTPHIITRIGWAARNDFYYGPNRMVLGVFQGANKEDFSDAIPLHIVKEKGTIGSMDYADVECSRGFRYVRYVGPNDARCNIAEIEFYGRQGDGDDKHLNQLTNLPTVVINTENAQEPFDKVTDIKCNVIIIDNNKIDTEATATVRERGNASRNFPKKPWRVKFDKKQKPFGAPAKAKKWTLINNYGDKSLMRNEVAFEISKRMEMPWTPFIRSVDVVMNGEYKGTYQFCDQVELASGRIEGDEIGIDENSEPEITGAYHIEIDAYADTEESYFISRRGIPVTIKSPDEDEITPQQAQYIENHFNIMEGSTVGPLALNQSRGYRNYLDADSWQRMMLVEEIVGNPDELWSIHCVKRRNDNKIYVASLWDFDIAFDNDIRYTNFDYGVDVAHMEDYLWKRIVNPVGLRPDEFSIRSIFETMFENDSRGVEEIKKLWSKAYNEYDINSESLCRFIDEMRETLNQSAELNFMRWPVLNDRVHNNPIARGSFDAEVDFMKDFITNRMNSLTKVIGDPTSSSINDVADDMNIENAAVYDLTGKALGVMSSDDINNLPKGIYIVKYKNTVKKFVR